MTGLEYIQAALEILGVYTEEESISSSDKNVAFRFLNNMLDTWSASIGPVYAETQESFNLTTSISYTVGPTGDFVTARPLTILRAYVRDNQDIDHKLRLMPNREYQDFLLKDPGDALPWALGYNMTNPDITIYLYPPPDSTYSLRLTSNKALADAVLSSEYAVPAGYNDALIWGLAVRLAPVFNRQNVVGVPSNPASIAGQANKMYRGLLIANTEGVGVDQDPLLPGKDHVLRSWRYD